MIRIRNLQYFKNIPSIMRPCRLRRYSMCCPPRMPPGFKGCPPPVPGGGRRIVPPADCRPTVIPPNPCVPRYYHGKNTWKKYKYLALFVCFPVIILQAIHAFGHTSHPKGICRDYEYMRRRTKKYPWGDGNQTFFHNDRVNHLSTDCEPPLLDCD